MIKKLFWLLFLVSACTNPVPPDFDKQTLHDEVTEVPAAFTFVADEYTPALMIRVAPSVFEIYSFKSLAEYRTWRADHTGLVDIVWVHIDAPPAVAEQ